MPVEVDGLALLLVADLDGKIFAIANSCPHLGTPLENGRSVEFSRVMFSGSGNSVFIDSVKDQLLFARFTRARSALRPAML